MTLLIYLSAPPPIQLSYFMIDYLAEIAVISDPLKILRAGIPYSSLIMSAPYENIQFEIKIFGRFDQGLLPKNKLEFPATFIAQLAKGC